jgi:quinol monooxygenase YgiN
MHIQVVNFNLHGMSATEYRHLCDELAPVFAEMPGLVSKVWLADEEANTYGGVYTWVDRAAMDAYLRSDVFSAVAANPSFANITSTDFEVLESPSRVTRARAVAAG